MEACCDDFTNTCWSSLKYADLADLFLNEHIVYTYIKLEYTAEIRDQRQSYRFYAFSHFQCTNYIYFIIAL